MKLFFLRPFEWIYILISRRLDEHPNWNDFWWCECACCQSYAAEDRDLD